jgi:hypothetical protein
MDPDLDPDADADPYPALFVFGFQDAMFFWLLPTVPTFSKNIYISLQG